MVEVLLVEDEVSISQAIVMALLHYRDYNVKVVESLKEALSLLPGNYDVIITDLSLPDSKGVHTIMALQQTAPKIPIIVVTGGGDCDMAQAIHFGAQDYIQKGDFTFKELVRSVRAGIERHKVRAMFKPIEEDLKQAGAMITEIKNLSGKVDC